jgi:hypothetical protein
MRAVASNRDVIDPKYDSCTKLSARQRLKKILATDIRRRGIKGQCVLKSTHADRTPPIM